MAAVMAGVVAGRKRRPIAVSVVASAATERRRASRLWPLKMMTATKMATAEMTAMMATAAVLATAMAAVTVAEQWATRLKQRAMALKP